MRAPSAALSFTVHVAIVLAAVRATARGAPPAPPPPPIFVVDPWLGPQPTGRPRGPATVRPDVPEDRFRLPDDLSTLGPPDVDLPVRDAHSWPAPRGADSGAVRRVYGDERGPLDVDLVEDRPELLAAPLPVYPDLLRQAGLEGRVVLEAVIDTTGRVEARSITVVAATNPGFVDAARRALAASLFRPARVRGAAVRVRIRLATAFVLDRHT